MPTQSIILVEQINESDLRTRLKLEPNTDLPKIRLLAVAEDESTGDAFCILIFKKHSGLALMMIHRASIVNIGDIVALLLGKNAILPSDQKVSKALVGAALNSALHERWKFASHVGWRGNYAAFVGHKFVEVAKSEPPTLKQPLWLNGNHKLAGATAGDLQTWIDEVAKPAMCSTRIMLFLAAAFAAPLVGLVGLQSFIINLFGESKTGKTAAILAGGSVIGIGQENHLPNFSATAASMMELARVYNDMILPMNEVGLLKGKSSGAYEQLRETTFRYSEGAAPTVHTLSGFATVSSASNWHGIMETSSEKSVDEFAQSAGQSRDNGEYARWHDIPALAENMPTVCDRFPKALSEANREEWSRKKIIQVRKACQENHGHAFIAYIKFLISKNKSALKPKVDGSTASFLDRLDFPFRNGAMEHAAKNFALIYAGGVQGIEAGLLPWTEKALFSAIKKCLKDCLGEITTSEDVEKNARDILERKLTESSLPSKEKYDALDDFDKIGYYVKMNNSKNYLIHTTEFQKWFPNKAHINAVLRWLHHNRLLILRDGQTLRPNSVEWATKFVKDAERRNQRYFEFRDPRSV